MNSLSFFLEYSIVGIASGGVYALIALGIIVIFKSSRTFNFAMGEMMMLSAYMFYTAAVRTALLTALGHERYQRLATWRGNRPMGDLAPGGTS